MSKTSFGYTLIRTLLRKNLVNNRGYTLIELLVVLVVTSLLFGIGVINFRDFSRKQAILGEGKNLQADLRLTQERALAGDKKCTTPATEHLVGYRFRVVNTTTYAVEAVCSNGTTQTYRVIKQVILGSGAKITTPAPTAIIIFKSLGQGTNVVAGNDTVFYIGTNETPIQFVITSTGEISSSEVEGPITGL